MIFEKAYKELLAGKKIRRKEWEKLMHMKMIDGKIKTFKGEYTQFYDNAHSLLNDGWRIVDGDGKNLKFVDAIEELRQKKCLTRDDWIEEGKEQFVFVDNGQFALCKQVEFDFMPTWVCLTADDWCILK